MYFHLFFSMVHCMSLLIPFSSPLEVVSVQSQLSSLLLQVLCLVKTRMMCLLLSPQLRREKNKSVIHVHIPTCTRTYYCCTCTCMMFLNYFVMIIMCNEAEYCVIIFTYDILYMYMYIVCSTYTQEYMYMLCFCVH